MTTSADDARPVNEKIAYALRRDIELGKLKPEEKAPSVREIADRFKVAPGTASRALQVLTKWGYTRPDSTRGYFVNPLSDAEAAPSGTNPDFTALMREMASIRDEVQQLSNRLRHLEEAAGQE